MNNNIMQSNDDRIITLLRKQPRLSINQISMKTGIDYTTTWRAIYRLQEEGNVVIEEIGGAKIVSVVDDARKD